LPENGLGRSQIVAFDMREGYFSELPSARFFGLLSATLPRFLNGDPDQFD
jgi:hypothetical protein